MFYLAEYPDDPPGYVQLSTSTEWEAWLNSVIPATVHADVRSRLRSNLKHILVGLEMKTALIIPHAERISGRAVLFEPYFQIMIFEFCVGVFSTCEGLGSALWLHGQNNDGSGAPRIPPNNWIGALVAAADPQGGLNLDVKLRGVKATRDKIHQDQLGARTEIDWHAFDYGQSFVPARDALATILRLNPGNVPATTNLRP